MVAANGDWSGETREMDLAVNLRKSRLCGRAQPEDAESGDDDDENNDPRDGEEDVPGPASAARNGRVGFQIWFLNWFLIRGLRRRHDQEQDNAEFASISDLDGC
jgi:hypothetical protein